MTDETRSDDSQDSVEAVDALVRAAVLTGDPMHLDTAAALAGTPRQRQLLALARIRLEGNPDRFDALVRDHMVEHPGDLPAAWIASRPRPEESSS